MYASMGLQMSLVGEMWLGVDDWGGIGYVAA
jgi:hypothetical protein